MAFSRENNFFFSQPSSSSEESICTDTTTTDHVEEDGFEGERLQFVFNPHAKKMSLSLADPSGRDHRRDSSPIGQFLLDKSRRSLRAVKARAVSLTFDNVENEELGDKVATSTNGSQDLNQHVNSSTAYQSALGQREDAVFEKIAYLGCSKIQDPCSETEMLQIITNFNEEKSHDAVNVSLLIPSTSSGTVRLFESGSNSEISSFAVHKIRFCARGQPDSPERGCFALSFTQFHAGSQALHQCHVLRCQVPEAAGRALMCFANAFRNTDLPSTTSSPSSFPLNFHSFGGEAGEPLLSEYATKPGLEEYFEFEAFLEIKEEDSKKGFIVCPVEKNCFKMRRDREKRVVIVLRQTGGPRLLVVKKCFGLLLAAGRNLRQADMHLLDMQSMSEGQNNAPVYIVEALWNPSAQNFEVLNTETPKETRVFMTIAIDVILNGIDEPVRFNMECKARIFQQWERFWYIPRKAITERYFLTVKMNEANTCIKHPEPSEKAPVPEPCSSEMVSKPGAAITYQVIRFESVTERERNMSKVFLDGRSPTKMPTQLIHPADEDESDSDEPLLSGSGEVNKECSDDLLSGWKVLIEQWKEEPEKRPHELNALMNAGLPDMLRGEVWQLLAKVHVDLDLIQTYRMLLDKECPSEQVILRDIHRTFPAHDFFKESNGVGQESLYKISKAYSLYDEEVSYCQGLSFLAAALLLHMAEDKAFCVLIKIMFDYGLRDNFKLGFDTLHLRFFQLQRLIEDYEHELYTHFYTTGVETHMYASQWFLTLFTAKFPLQMVFLIVDLFLTEGVNTIFHISLALLQDSKKDLLQLDFEGILKYFRVTLPRRYRTENNAKELIRNAVKLKISHKRLSKYEKEYHSIKQRELESLDPVERVERENLSLRETILRLERENDDLAHELVTSKIELRNKLDMTEDQLETTVVAVERKTRECHQLQDEAKNLKEESEMVKNMCRQEVARLEDEILSLQKKDKRSQSTLDQYKKICKDLGSTFEADKLIFEEQKKEVLASVFTCSDCTTAVVQCFSRSPKLKSDLLNGSQDSSSNNHTFLQNGIAKNNNNTSCMGQLDGSWTAWPAGGAVHIVELMDKLDAQEEHIRQVELELAQTKLALVETKCYSQELAHQMTTSMNADSTSMLDARPAWFKKTISSIRDVGTSLKN